ncbi:AEC family transporter [Ruminococcaceae bacterium OttesenSCG-928-A16]|nr:AEC family transporter [Ruminococcaceae bacterium OttesenSCG-928-A16]
MSLDLFSQIIVIFLLAAAGYAARKRSMINDQIQTGLSSIVLSISVPASILAAANMDMDPRQLNNIVVILVGALVYFIVALALGMLLGRLLWLNPKQQVIFTNLVGFSNAAFIGYPIIKIFLPTTGIFLASFFVLVFNLCFFTFGIGRTAGQTRFSLRSIFGNINTLACFIMVALYFLQLKLPSPLQTTLETLGNLSTPLSMLVIGSMLANIRIKDLFTTPSLYLSTALRLLILPTITFLIVRGLALPGQAATVLLIMSGLPSASLTVIAAEKYSCEPLYASKGVLLSTLLFLGTIPYIAFLQAFLA